ncbi:MAG: hypothetical protein R6U85_07650 [Salinivirgaceae bacterium]
MKKLFLLISMALATGTLFAQTTDSTTMYTNTAEKLLQTDGKLKIGGYGEVHYNQPLNSDMRKNGTLDVHRMVMLFGYQFDERTQFITEIEYEHVEEVYIEQAWLQYKLTDFINLRGGLMLIPMGIVNEYHEPTTFNGVERPLTDKYIAPSTWREIGFGATGTILPATLRYQFYVVNGFNGYDGNAKFNGSGGLRGGRQKGIKSYISSPNFTGKVEYFGIRGLNIGLSAYYGKSQSTLYNNLDKNDNALEQQADSSVIDLFMLGADARYQIGGLSLRGQFYFSSLGNTDQYNAFTASGTELNDLGSSMTGLYVEAGYNVLKHVSNADKRLVPFVRYANYNTHASVNNLITQNESYNKTVITTGLSFHLSKGAVVKGDVQMFQNEADNTIDYVLNTGIGVMF